MLESYLSAQAPETKMSLSLLAGGVMSSGALALCWLTGSDPWGKRSPAYTVADPCMSGPAELFAVIPCSRHSIQVSAQKCAAMRQHGHDSEVMVLVCSKELASLSAHIPKSCAG